MIDEHIPKKWITRQELVYTRKLLIIVWLMLTSNILIWSYKGTLLSTLVPIYYENPINTLEEVDRSGLPVMIPKNNVISWLVKTDPRSTIKNIWEKRILYPFSGGKVPDWVTQRYTFKNEYDKHTSTPSNDFYRMIEGSAGGIVEQGQKLLFINDYHCGENLATFPSSYVLPKGSPLKV